MAVRRSTVLLSKLGPSKGRGPLTAKRAPSLRKGFGSIGLGTHTKKGECFTGSPHCVVEDRSFLTQDSS
ncbi:hypothetical protein FOZ60_016258 [Perkinsus olseni]|uniref:Uncharacterized protein n=1 Tax=Perkinsus olseni TaxID=32597 RepID=A0A7J6N591_PEROL|nr:hypothetical protein FOZ60_016258 [Perkinsus olseni]